MAGTMFASYCFDDLLLRPSRSKIISRTQVSLETEIGSAHRSLKLNVPLISSPMDTVTGEHMAIKLALLGGLGIIHRYMSIEEQVSQVANVKRYVNYIFMEPYTISDTDTVSQAYQYQEYNGVSTLCVINPATGQCVGLATHRDLASKPLDMPINNIMTPVDKLYKLNITPELAELLRTAHPGAPEFADIMLQASQLMDKHAVEKIPVFCCIAGGESVMEYPAKLFGLITRRSVQHYFNNQSTASLDTKGRLRVGAAIGIRDGFLEHAGKLIDAGVDLICVDVANGHNIGTLDAVRALRSAYPDLVIMAGNICTLEGYMDLAEAGVDCVRIGIGNGSICTTRLETGVGFGQWSSLKECADYIFAQPDYEKLPKLICDGGTLGKTGNKVKALAIGASAIMLGRTLGSCEESPGLIVHRNGKKMKYFRGMASTMANLSKQENQLKRKRLDTEFTAEGVDGMVDLKGSVADVISQVAGGLRSGLSYLGAATIMEVHSSYNKIQWALCTAIGQSETGIRVSTL